MSDDGTSQIMSLRAEQRGPKYNNADFDVWYRLVDVAGDDWG